MLRDPGTFWHVASGQRILATGTPIRNDPFSFTRHGQPWVDDQWLAECGMAAIHRLDGWDGLLLATAAIVAAVFAWIAARLLRGGLHPMPAALLAAVMLLAAAPQFHVRPLVLTIAFLAVTFAWLLDVESGAVARRRLWWLVPLFILWANVHGGVLAGIGTAGLCLGGWQIAKLASFPHARRDTTASWLGTAVLLAAMVAAVLVNPYGPALPRAWFETLAMPLPNLLEEHGRLGLAEPFGWATLALGAFYVAVLLGVFPKRPRVCWLVPVVWLAFAVARSRNAPLFAVTAGLALADMLPHSRVGRWLERRGLLKRAPHCLASRPWRLRPLLLPAVVVVAVAAIQLGDVRLPVVGRGWARFDAERWPIALLPELDKINRFGAPGTPIFNDLNFGGFLIYHEPRLRVFIDDRCSLYGAKFLQAYDRARRNDPAAIERWRREYGFRHALVASGGRFDEYLSSKPAWKLLGRSPAAALYERSN